MKAVGARKIGSPCLIALLLAAFPVILNSTNPVIAEQDPTSGSSSDEVLAASGLNRFVVWYDNTPGNYDVLFKRSTDSGATWGATKNLSANPGNSLFPQIAVSGTNVYVVWKQDSADGSLSDVFFRRSTDNGATWGAKINISTSGPTNKIPQLAVSGSNVYIAWGEGSGGDSGDIFLRRSTDNGATWKAVVNLSNNPEGYNVMGEIAVSGNNVYVVWDPLSLGEILFRRSTDNGATWKPILNLSNNVEDSSRPHITASGSNVYVVWEDWTPGNSDIFFKRSTDNGATWKTTKNLSANVPHSYNPQVAASGSSVYVVWLQGRTSGPNYDLSFRASNDNGATWGPKFKINTEKMGIGDSPSIATSGSNLYFVWRQSAPGEPAETFFRQSTDNGATWKSPVNLSNNPTPSGVPEIAVSGSNLYVAWNNGPGSTEILSRRSTDDGATWKATVNLSNNSGSSLDAQFGV